MGESVQLKESAVVVYGYKTFITNPDQRSSVGDQVGPICDYIRFLWFFKFVGIGCTGGTSFYMLSKFIRHGRPVDKVTGRSKARVLWCPAWTRSVMPCLAESFRYNDSVSSV